MQLEKEQTPLIVNTPGHPPRETDWLGAAEAWIALILALVVWFEFFFPLRSVGAEPQFDFRRPAYPTHFEYLSILDGIAIGVAVAGIRFAPGVSRWVAVLAGLLGGAMFCLLAVTWSYLAFSK
jgi:hypothetical protein